ncbi:MAG: T9SS type A sorting domain-containing protein [Flavobacteriales bacterium]|nr:T9SS type A sorting domain-containing protein [Flavobacteriales bacterium]
MKALLPIVFVNCTLGASAQLTGTFTVGGASPDYTTLIEAVNDLNAEGATGNVVFNIRPGTYTGQYDLGIIGGAPGSITFKSETNNAADVILEHDASGSVDNYIFRLEATDNLVFQALTFRPVNTWFARAINFYSECNLLSIASCVFEGSTEPNQNSGFERTIIFCGQNVIGTEDNPQDVIISDNIFHNGYAGMELDFAGDLGARSEGLIITDNLFDDQYATAITVHNAVGQIGDNIIRTSHGNFFTGIRTSFFDHGSQIRRNRIEAYATTGGCTGIECGNTQNTTGNMISNNMVYCHASGDVWGLAVYNMWDMKILHNSVLVDAGNAAQSYAFYHLSNFADGQDALVRNNIFANNAGGFAYKVSVAGNVGTEDHNDLFSTGTEISSQGAATYADVAAHQSGTGQGTGDVDHDPGFPFVPDLHLNSCALDGAGEYFFVSAADIDGHARGNPACDIGADEFSFNAGTVSMTVDITDQELPYILMAPSGGIYLWSQGSTTRAIEAPLEGPYTCEFTDANGCTYTLQWTLNVDYTTGLSEAAVIPDDVLYPNPARMHITLPNTTGATWYNITDLHGRNVQEGPLTDRSPIDICGLTPGIYVVRWADGDAWWVGRVVKE